MKLKHQAKAKNFSFALFILFMIGCASTSFKKTELMTGPTLKSFDQTELKYRIWSPQIKTKSKGTVIIVHGLKDHSGRYQNFGQYLSNNDYTIYAFDLRGHGQSEGQRVWVNEFNDYLKDLEKVIELVRSHESGPLFLFGHSMGGAIVTLKALENKKRIDGLILSAPALKPGADINRFLIGTTNVLGSILPTLAVLDLKDENFSKDPNTIKEMQGDPLIYHKNGPARTAKELLKALDEIQFKMPEMSTPFLVLHGDQDKLTNPEGSKDLYEKAIVKDKTLKIYPGLYHDLLHEPENEQIKLDILLWLNQHIVIKHKLNK